MKKNPSIYLLLLAGIVSACFPCANEECPELKEPISFQICDPAGNNVLDQTDPMLQEADFLIYNISKNGDSLLENSDFYGNGVSVNLSLEYDRYLIVIADTNRYLLETKSRITQGECCKHGELDSLKVSDSIPCLPSENCTQYFRLGFSSEDITKDCSS